MRKKVIEFKDFSFKYDVQKYPTLKNINLTIYEGEKVLIVGPSGSGKSTIGNCINGLIPFVYKGEIKGSLKVNGIETKESSLFELNKNIGTVLQDPDGQFVGLTAGEDIAFSLENDCVPKNEMIKKVNEIARMVDMEDRLENNPRNLSGGQKQRVSMAGVMVNETDILLFDEPLANLDPKTGKTAIELIDDINKLGKTIVIIEHRLEDALYRHVDRIVVVKEGEIIMDDVPNKVLSSDVLIDNGIREPLYVTACKYAGIKITEDMYPESIDSFNIENYKEDLNKWYKENENKKPKEDEEVLFEAKNITFSYDDEENVLKDVSFKVNKGEMVSLVGKNGAGKSTISKIVVGFEKQDKGHLYLENECIDDDTIYSRGQKIGLILQNPNQMISKTRVFDEVSLGLLNRGLSLKQIDEKVDEILKICGLSRFKNWPISALSFGQKKRVTIASILVMNPKVLILDEPTAGQDYKHYSDIMEFLKKLNENGQTIIMITHDMHLMLEYTSRALVLTSGRLLADKDVSEVLYDKDLVEAANLKETSLFELAKKAGIDELGFVNCFIRYDEKVRKHETE